VGCGERDDRWVPLGGERGGKDGWVGLVLVSWAGWLPGAAQVGSWPLSFIFFLLLSFFFCSDFCFEFLKKLFYSDLNKIKADHFWSLKSVFKTYKPEV
jgi:hypothetical protein